MSSLLEGTKVHNVPESQFSYILVSRSITVLKSIEDPKEHFFKCGFIYQYYLYLTLQLRIF